MALKVVAVMESLILCLVEETGSTVTSQRVIISLGCQTDRSVN